MRYYVAALAMLLALWQLAAYVINKPYLPPFTDVVLRMATDYQLLAKNLAVTLMRIATAVALDLSVGLAAGLAAAWLSEKISANLLRALILLTYPIPHVALAVTATAPHPPTYG